jgi:hypothetical protein
MTALSDESWREIRGNRLQEIETPSRKQEPRVHRDDRATRIVVITYAVIEAIVLAWIVIKHLNH